MKTKMELKKSQYNYVVSLENNYVVVFNGVSKAIGRFKPQQFDIVKIILEKPNVSVSTFQDGFIIKSYLIRNGFLISKNLDEFETLKERNRIAINGKYSFDLLILPTLDCNFRCFYCYEEHRPVNMSQKVEERIKNWTKKNLESYTALNLSWFGGEPLLRVDTILRLSDFFQNFCKQHGKVFTNMITTNGYLLTRDNINNLKDVGLKHFHVTLDGSSHWHNQFRVHRNNSATYTQIVDGVNRVLDQIQDARITIRVNYNKDNFNDIPELFSVFPNKSKKRISLIFRQIFGDLSDSIALPEKSKREMEYYTMAAEQGYCSSLVEAFQGPKETYCYADKKGALIIGPEAELFRCGVGTFDSDSKMGDLRYDGTIEWKTEKLTKWEAVNGFDDPDCIKCGYLPLCMGGCRANRAAGKTKIGCDQPYELLEDMLKISCSGAVAP